MHYVVNWRKKKQFLASKAFVEVEPALFLCGFLEWDTLKTYNN